MRLDEAKPGDVVEFGDGACGVVMYIGVRPDLVPVDMWNAPAALVPGDVEVHVLSRDGQPSRASAALCAADLALGNNLPGAI